MAELLNIFSILVLIKIKKRNPIKELYFFLIAIILISIGYLTYLFNAYQSEPYHFDSASVPFVRLGYFRTIIGIFLISYAFLLIDFEPNHAFLYKMSLLTAISFSSAFYNA